MFTYPFNFITELAYDRQSEYVGCYRDYSQLHHLERLVAKGQMTPQICIHLCRDDDYAFAGLSAGYVSWS